MARRRLFVAMHMRRRMVAHAQSSRSHRILPPIFALAHLPVPEKSIRAWTRFSNGSFTPGDDTGLDGRGMALKILDAAPDGQAHDILMINHPDLLLLGCRGLSRLCRRRRAHGRHARPAQVLPARAEPVQLAMRQALIAYRIASAPDSVTADHLVLLDGSVRVRT